MNLQKFYQAVMIAGSGLMLGSPFAQAMDHRNPDACVGIDSGGGEIPIYAGRSHYELVNQERYTLIGRIVRMGNEMGFEVNLKVQPWLAPSTRAKAPVYPITGGPSDLENYMGKTIEGNFMAHLEMTSEATPQYVMTLEVLGFTVLPDNFCW